MYPGKTGLIWLFSNVCRFHSVGSSSNSAKGLETFPKPRSELTCWLAAHTSSPCSSQQVPLLVGKSSCVCQAPSHPGTPACLLSHMHTALSTCTHTPHTHKLSTYISHMHIHAHSIQTQHVHPIHINSAHTTHTIDTLAQEMYAHHTHNRHTFNTPNTHVQSPCAP